MLAGAAQAQTQARTLVRTAAPQPVQWRAQAELSAHLAAIQQATLAPARGGIVTAVNFQSGQAVQAGQILVVLDIGPEQAQLALDQAKLTQAAHDLARTEKLMTISGASQAALEQAQAAMAESRAQITLDAATLAQGEIIAPFSGVAGIRTLNPGDYVQAGQSITSLTAPGRLKVYFAVPQSEAGQLSPGARFILTAPLGTGTNITAAGTLAALSPALNTATDARDAEGLLDAVNPRLLSGMNGVVEIATGAPVPAFAIPGTAVNDSMLGPYIFVIEPTKAGGILHSVYVKILDSTGADSIVSAPGLKAGQKIVALGGFQLNDGQAVSLP